MGNVTWLWTAAELGSAIATKTGQEFWAIANRRVLGLLELSLNNPARAVEHLQPPARARIATLDMPSNCDFLETAIEAFVAVGDLDAAAELLDALQARAKGIDSPWERAIGARCRGFLQSAQGDHDGALEAFDDALREHEQLNLPFDRDARSSRAASCNDGSSKGVPPGHRSRSRSEPSRSSAPVSGPRVRAPS